MKALPTGVPASRADRPATALLYEDVNARIVSFHLLPDQEVAPHRSRSTVVVQVLEGEGLFQGDAREVRLTTGQTAVFDPDEMHAIKSVGGSLRFLAVLSPRPS
jgi:quercetin dioxygenase-like cupin family protein